MLFPLLLVQYLCLARYHCKSSLTFCHPLVIPNHSYSWKKLTAPFVPFVPSVTSVPSVPLVHHVHSVHHSPSYQLLSIPTIPINSYSWTRLTDFTDSTDSSDSTDSMFQYSCVSRLCDELCSQLCEIIPALNEKNIARSTITILAKLQFPAQASIYAIFIKNFIQF